MLGITREVPFLFLFIIFVHSSLILSPTTPSPNPHPPFNCKIVQWLSWFPEDTHTIMLDAYLRPNMTNNFYVAFDQLTAASSPFGLIQPNPIFVEQVLIWQNMGIIGVLVTDGNFDPGRFAWSNVYKYYFPVNITIPIGIVSPLCLNIIRQYPQGLNATVEGWDSNGWVNFVTSPGYIAWSVSLAFFYTVNMAVASYKLVKGFLFYGGVEVNIALICLTMEFCGNFLRMLQMVFIPLLNRWKLPYAVILQTVAQPFTISSSILLIFFWLDLTSGSLYEGNLLSVMRIPTLVTIICIFLIEIFIDIFRCLYGDAYSGEVLIAVYSSIHAVTAMFYFYAASKIFKTGNELSKGKSNYLRCITIQVVFCGVSIFCTLVMVVCLLAQISQTTPAGSFATTYLLWFTFVPQSLLQITIFGNQEEEEKVHSVGKSDSLPIHKTDSSVNSSGEK